MTAMMLKPATKRTTSSRSVAATVTVIHTISTKFRDEHDSSLAERVSACAHLAHQRWDGR